ncbi:M20 family metallopeptidase [Rhizobium rhizoryzae]|jgi:acetylornithine deacetylase/succinyl-diaminopimelate desuccinylase-like protein|uniref:Acetylornithine deacetylase/succinyl-diaminopimelate desuccinylase-like protein n=1 Tax=Rhizobium rhizoryzae TaxID=451876 RepID=A0A7W6PRB8_9HYPH|nr:M20 family metallopeptidase [Rhizobium rhizoryzae]MBB4143759.1 acetylornithine deacetylase/succinyl-diaminopimelate desuccinylase-like protein [Rhizobium rhizoryzae]
MNDQQLVDTAHSLAEGQAFFDTLSRLIARRSISQSEGQVKDLHAYLQQDMLPLLEPMGFDCRILDNPTGSGGPFLIAERIEDEKRPTILIYGHGDVCNGEAARWRSGLNPFVLSREGDRLYGRGTADNKIQHLINILALRHIIEHRGSLGFNVRLLIEMGEETGSKGLHQLCEAHRQELAADVLIASDGPRLQADIPTMFMGSRGGVSFELRVDLREGEFHSGNFGGLLADPVTLLAHAIATIVDARGQILVPEWRPDSLTDDIRAALRGLPDRRHDADWGEESLTPAERVFGWNSFAVLAISAGNIAAPQNAICGTARAACQLRFVVGTNMDELLPSLRRHLDAHGYPMVEVHEVGHAPFKATRFPPDHPWVRFVERSIMHSTGKSVHVLPNLAGSLPNDVFTDILGLPTIWIPHSHAECGQHGPNEHALVSIAGEGLRIMTALFLDIGKTTELPS